jgi:hypothetical protein
LFSTLLHNGITNGPLFVYTTLAFEDAKL